MGLNCSCIEWDGEPGTWLFYPADDFIKLDSKRRKRCSSCGEFIEINSDCLVFPRDRAPYTDVEQRIMGDEIPMAPLHMCERCGEIWLNLQAAGFCLTPADDMRDALEKYQHMTGFDPKKYTDISNQDQGE